MKSICLFFQIHQPFRCRRYHFFEVGNDHYYYDDYSNETILNDLAKDSYLPAGKMLLELIDKLEGKFKVAFSISGTALEQFELYSPETLEMFKELAKTGCVEFLSETYSNSLSSLNSTELFKEQVERHRRKVRKLFGQDTKVFRNTAMIYSDQIGVEVEKMGFAGILTEGAKHVLGWKSPNYLYVNSLSPRLKVLMRNFSLSDDISFRFSQPEWSEYPLTADKFILWINRLDPKQEIVNLFLNFEVLGHWQKVESGIFEFFKTMPRMVLENSKYQFRTPTEIIDVHQPVSVVSVPEPISWADEERDLTAWIGNPMQKEAMSKLLELGELVKASASRSIQKDWNYLQQSDHFFYMSTKHLSGGQHHFRENYFESPFEAFINYMNVLTDFRQRLEEKSSNRIRTQEEWQIELKKKDKIIERLQNELNALKGE